MHASGGCEQVCVVSAKLLARTTAVLAAVDLVLDDPFPAAVDRLPGVAGSWWLCHHPTVVQIGASDLDHAVALSPMIIGENPTPNPATCAECVPDEIFDTEGCWADDDLFPAAYDLCGAMPTTDLGLCAHHHDQIVPMEATP